jgi:hypothetical protein
VTMPDEIVATHHPKVPASRSDPRINEPTRADRQRVWKWLALLALSPLCVGLAIWATSGPSPSYPTVKPPVPHGWQAVPGIYASFSVPRGWVLENALSDQMGDVYYSGRGGGAGESVTEANQEPSAATPLPAIIRAFLQENYRVTSSTNYRLHNAAVAWLYRFKLADGTTAAAVHAWVRSSDTDAWLVASPVNPTTQEVLRTLALGR